MISALVASTLFAASSLIVSDDLGLRSVGTLIDVGARTVDVAMEFDHDLDPYTTDSFGRQLHSFAVGYDIDMDINTGQRQQLIFDHDDDDSTPPVEYVIGVDVQITGGLIATTGELWHRTFIGPVPSNWQDPVAYSGTGDALSFSSTLTQLGFGDDLPDNLALRGFAYTFVFGELEEYQYFATGAIVPEPQTLTLLIAGATTLFRRRTA